MSRHRKVFHRSIIYFLSALLAIISATITLVGPGSAAYATTSVHGGNQNLAQKPYMGWSSWSLQSTQYPGVNPNGNYSYLTEANVLANAQAMHTKLQSHGYNYVNLDSGWYADWNWNFHIDANGRYGVDSERFPHGLKWLGDQIHALGLKFGIYLPVGMDQKAYDGNYPVLGTSCTTQQIAVAGPVSTNGFRRGWVAIDYSNPCSQKYINSIANELAGWGVDFLKLDGVTPGSNINGASATDNRADVKAWSQALQQTGRPIQFIVSWSLDHNYASYWKQYTNGWRVDGDVECYCSTLVTWNRSVVRRWTDVVPWIGDAGPGGWNNLDSLNVGVGTMDGLTDAERQSTMTLWAIEAAPLYSGDDLTKLDSYGLSLLTNEDVIAVDQAGHPAKPVSQTTNQQVWYAKNSDGTYTVALFNLDSTTATVQANWSDLGFTGKALVRDLWSHKSLGASENFSASLDAHASRLLNVRPLGNQATN